MKNYNFLMRYTNFSQNLHFIKIVDADMDAGRFNLALILNQDSIVYMYTYCRQPTSGDLFHNLSLIVIFRHPSLKLLS